MTYYSKCKNCSVDIASCERRGQIKAAIKGLGVTSLKFKCEERQPFFRPGQRVKFQWRFWNDDHRDLYGDVDQEDLEITGTVINENEAKGRFVVAVDDAPIPSGHEPDNLFYDRSEVFKNGGKIISVKPSDMQALDEPNRPICPACYAVDDMSECMKCEWFDPGKNALCNVNGVTDV